MSTRFGRVYLVRVGLLVLALPVIEVFVRAARLPRWWPVVGGGLGLAIVATPGFAGHAAVGDYEPFALAADVAHVGAASVWLGGLAMLTLFVLPRRADDLKALVRRYSEVAFWAVVVLVATGLFQGWRQVGSVDALTSTRYGTLLMIKTRARGRNARSRVAEPACDPRASGRPTLRAAYGAPSASRRSSRLPC